MKRVLVTGVKGFVGGHLCSELLRHEYEVTGLSRVSDEGAVAGIDMFEGDVLIADTLVEALSRIKPDYIVHLAAQAKPGYSFGHAQETFEVNVFGTLNILDAVKIVSGKVEGYGPRILLIGTSEEYGSVTSAELPLSENARLNPTNPYAVSKVAAYYLSQQYVKTDNLDIVYAVPFSHIGPGQREGFLIPDVCKQIVEIENGERENVLVTGPLVTKRDYCDVRDIVRGYRMLLELGRKGERYNLGSGESVGVDVVVDTLIGLSKTEISHVIDDTRKRPTELLDLYADVSKINKLCGWKAEIGLQKTLRDALSSCRT